VQYEPHPCAHRPELLGWPDRGLRNPQTFPGVSSCLRQVWCSSLPHLEIVSRVMFLVRADVPMSPKASMARPSGGQLHVNAMHVVRRGQVCVPSHADVTTPKGEPDPTAVNSSTGTSRMLFRTGLSTLPSVANRTFRACSKEPRLP
jgi:hypothetical protein